MSIYGFIHNNHILDLQEKFQQNKLDLSTLTENEMSGLIDLYHKQINEKLSKIDRIQKKINN